MGQEASKIDLFADSAAAGLGQPWSHQYENEFEKQVFMAINLFRHDPKKWTSAVEECYKEDSELKKFKMGKRLIEYVKTCTALIPL